MEMENGIYPVEDGCNCGDILYGYTDLEEATRDYKKLTGEELDTENIRFLNVDIIVDGDEYIFSWLDQDKGIPSIINIY